MNKKTNLTQSQLEDLIRRYYAGEKNSALIDEFGLDVKVNQIHSLFPLIKRHDLICSYCQIHLVEKPLSKSASKAEWTNDMAFCEECGHRNYKYCRCDNCEKVRSKQADELINQKREVIRSTHRPKRSNLMDISTISLIDALSLASLARVSLDEKSNKLTSLKFHSLSFCVRETTTLIVLEKLHQSGLIEVSLDSDLRSVDLSQKEPSIDLHWSSWEFRLGKDEQENLMTVELLEKVFRNKNEWPASWDQEIAEVWKYLALEEIIAYLELKLVEHKFTPRIGDKTKKVFRTLLQELPIASIYNLIWVSVTNAAAYQVRSGISRQQAANTVIGNCQKRAERALNENWNLKGYKKDYRIPDSIRISIFSNVLTSLGESFYTRVPSAGYF